LLQAGTQSTAAEHYAGTANLRLELQPLRFAFFTPI
jgi:hypothetical protein